MPDDRFVFSAPEEERFIPWDRVLKGDKGDTGATGPQGPKGDPGNYTKPDTGIPETDLADNVRGLLDKADTALQPNGDGSDLTAAFTAASTRANITTGEKLSVLFGKIAKWFTDLGTAAFRAATGNVTQNSTDLVESGAVFNGLVELASETGIVVNGNTCALGASTGQYIILRNSTITGLADGLYTAAKAIPVGQTIDATYLTGPVTNGAVNALSAQVDNLLAGKATIVKSGWAHSMTLSGVTQLYLQVNISIFAVSITVPEGTPTINMARMGDYTTAQYNTSVTFNIEAAGATVTVEATSANSLTITLSEGYNAFMLAIY